MITETLDQTDSIFDLLMKAMPERERYLSTFWDEYSVRFEEGTDKRGIVMNATKDRVKYARKDVQVI